MFLTEVIYSDNWKHLICIMNILTYYLLMHPGRYNELRSLQMKYCDRSQRTTSSCCHHWWVMVELIFHSTCSKKKNQIERQCFMKHLYYWKRIHLSQKVWRVACTQMPPLNDRDPNYIPCIMGLNSTIHRQWQKAKLCDREEKLLVKLSNLTEISPCCAYNIFYSFVGVRVDIRRVRLKNTLRSIMTVICSLFFKILPCQPTTLQSIGAAQYLARVVQMFLSSRLARKSCIYSTCWRGQGRGTGRICQPFLP